MYKGLIFNITKNSDYVRNSGSYRIATFLRELGWDIEVIDWTPFFTLKELKLIFNSRYDSNLKFCGFGTLFNYWDSNVNSFLNWIKESYPDIITVIGGQSAHVIGASPHYFINGYAENALLSILNYHFTNSTEELKLDKDFLKFNKRVVHYNYYPSTPLKSLLIKYEKRDYIEPQERLNLEFSRGCIFECKFCSFPILGVKTDYSRDAEDLEIHLKEIYNNYGVTNFYVADETFNDSTKKLEKFSKIFDTLPFKTHLSGFIRADLLISKSRKDDIEHLLKMGFFGHLYGVETFNQNTGKIIGKGMDPEKIKEGLLDIKKTFSRYGHYRGSISMIVGLPEEDKESIESSVDWLLNNWNDQNFYYWPLELSINNLKDKPSLLSMNKQKYGYTESPEPLESISQETGTVNSKFNWKNNHFTYNSAKSYANNIFKRSVYKGVRLGNFELNKYMHFYNNIEDVLKIEYKDIAKFGDKDFPPLVKKVNNILLSKIEKYKENKINNY